MHRFGRYLTVARPGRARTAFLVLALAVLLGPALTTLLGPALDFSPALFAGERAEDGDKLFLWRVQSESSTLYLLGSIHLANEDLYPLDPSIDAAFDDSSFLVVEANLNAVDNAAMQEKVLRSGTYGDGGTLFEDLPEGVGALLEKYLNERGIPAGSFNKMKPWLLSMTLTLMEMQRLGYAPEFGIDQHFLNLADEQDKPILELESAEFQIDLLSGFPNEMQARLLQQTLKEMEELPGRMKEILDAWHEGDTTALESMLFDEEDEEEFGAVYERIYDERNNAMVAKMRDYLRTEESYFVIVGAGHIVGEKGILQLLQRAKNPSYTIEQYPPRRQVAGARLEAAVH